MLKLSDLKRIKLSDGDLRKLLAGTITIDPVTLDVVNVIAGESCPSVPSHGPNELKSDDQQTERDGDITRLKKATLPPTSPPAS